MILSTLKVKMFLSFFYCKDSDDYEELVEGLYKGVCVSVCLYMIYEKSFTKNISA